MRTFRTVGIVGGTIALLLSASVVFAEGRVASTSIEKASSDYRMMAASSTARMQTMRADAQARMTAQREKVTQHMTEIQDKVKQEMAQRIAVQFDNLNSTWTDTFMKTLDQYNAIVQKMQDRANIAAAKGKDVTVANAAIQSAKTAITNARTAVVAQAAKTYTPAASAITPVTATTTPSGQEKIMKNLRTSFQNLHTALFKDLFALRDGPMKDARKAVQSALETLGKIPGVDEDTATSTSKSNQ